MKKIYPLLVLPLLLACSFFSSRGLQSDLVFSPDALPEAQAGAAYEAKIQISENSTPVGGANLVAGNLPDGLILELSYDEVDTVKIYGTPEQAGTYTFTVSVWCYGTNVSGQEGEREYTIVVK